jgi:hypothetical protein
MFQREQTHLCEAMNDKTAYCGLTVTDVDKTPVTDCNPPAKFGPVHRDCRRICKDKHPHRDNA